MLSRKEEINLMVARGKIILHTYLHHSYGSYKELISQLYPLLRNVFEMILRILWFTG